MSEANLRPDAKLIWHLCGEQQASAKVTRVYLRKQRLPQTAPDLL